MNSEEKILSAVRELFSGIEFTAEPAGLYDPLRYMISIGGKRLRPWLCLTTYSLYKDEFTPQILGPASALEVFHSFTLIHDDIMDKSPMRRGVDTVWKKWDEDTAILSGDVMCIDSYARMASAPPEALADVMALFSRTASQVCEGQQYDMEFESMEKVPMEDYIKMIGLKTGVLLACSAELGARIGGAGGEDCRNLYDYGYNLGLAFQIADDWLDAYGNEKVFGKPIGGDIVNSKKSWLTVRAFEKAGPETAAELSGALARIPSTEAERSAKISEVMAIYNSLNVGTDAQEEIERLTAKALSFAAPAASGEGFRLLESFARRLVGRTK
ncbi:MAG: polyprenyl synthetase family protein [Candidatus Cryptobacteroides sp.]